MQGDQQPHGTPDLILQAIVPPTDVPAEIRAAVAGKLAKREPIDGRTHTWEDVVFAACALAFVAGSNEPADPSIQWVFALRVEDPKPGQVVRSSGGWHSTMSAIAISAGTTRKVWRACLFGALTTEPRASPAAVTD